MYATTALTPDEQSKVPTPGYFPLTWDELARTVDTGARIYGYLEPADGAQWGEIVAVGTTAQLERYAGRLSFAWLPDARAFYGLAGNVWG